MNKVALAIILSAVSVSSFASHYVRGYSRSNGGYIQGHMSQDPGEARSSGYSYHNNSLYSNGY